VISGGQFAAISTQKFRSRNKRLGKGFFAGLRIRRANNQRAIGSELGKGWLSPEAHFVKPVDKRAGFLKLSLHEECRGNTNPAARDTGCVVAALRDFPAPVGEPFSIGFA